MDFFAELKALVGALESRAIDYAICDGVALAAARPQDIADVKRLQELARG